MQNIVTCSIGLLLFESMLFYHILVLEMMHLLMKNMIKQKRYNFIESLICFILVFSFDMYV